MLFNVFSRVWAFWSPGSPNVSMVQRYVCSVPRTRSPAGVFAAKVRGVSVVGRHRLEATPGGMRMTLELDYSGFAARVLYFQIRRTFVRNLEAESQGMQALAEGKART